MGDSFSDILAKRVHELKETQEGVDIMCREMDQIYKEGTELGEMKKAKEMALSLAGMGVSIEKIAEAAKVSVKVVQEWIAGNMNPVR